MKQLSHHDCHTGHPWYYLLGGATPSPKDIQAAVQSSDYCGYLAEGIEAIGRKPEPKKTQAEAGMRELVVAELRADMTRYRACTQNLYHHRRIVGITGAKSKCEDVHVAISLKHNHIYNGFAHLKALDALPKQLDLFG